MSSTGFIEAVSTGALDDGYTERVVYGPPRFPNSPGWSEVQHYAAVWEDAPIGGVAIVATPDTIMNDGGYTVAVQGLSTIPAGDYDVHIGPLVSALDPLAYSGVQGQGSAVTVVDDRFTFVSPRLPQGGPYALFLVNRATAATIATSAAVTVTPADFKSATYEIRRLLPRWWRNGPRSLTAAPFPQ